METKKIIKMTACFLIVAMLGIVGTGTILPDTVTTVHAAEKVKLNKKKVTLTKGETIKLKLRNAKGKVTWKSGKKSIATVSKKGVVKAKKKGKTKIYAKHKGKTYTCSLTVKRKVVSDNNIPQGKDSNKEESKQESIEMFVPEGRISTEHHEFTIVITNNTDSSISVSKEYKLEQQVDGRWEEIPMDKFGNKTILIEAKTSKELLCDLYEMKSTGYLKAGTYRIKKTAVTKEGEKELSAKFKVEEAVLDVSMEIVGESTVPVSADDVYFRIQNHEDNPIMVSTAYGFYRKENNEWVPVPLDFVFTCDMWTLEAKGIKEFGVNFYNSKGERICPPGEYKVTRSVAISGKGQTLSVEFTIVE